MSTRNELVTALTERYARSSKSERSVILDEFVAVSGYHRKHAIRLLGARQKRAAPERRARRRYGNAVREALIAVWEASDRVCSKRLKPLVAVLLPAHRCVRLGAATPRCAGPLCGLRGRPVAVATRDPR